MIRILRITLAIAALSLFGGCATISDTHARYLQSKCAIFGLEPGSAAHSTCFARESEEWQVKTWGDSFI